jgi:hypothetical protein
MTALSEEILKTIRVSYAAPEKFRRNILLQSPGTIARKIAETLLLVGETPALGLEAALFFLPDNNTYLKGLLTAAKTAAPGSALWATLKALGEAEQTLLLTQLLIRAMAASLFRNAAQIEPLERCREHLARGNPLLREAVGVYLRGIREKAQQPVLARRKGEARQHRRCLTCRHVMHRSSIVNMVGERSKRGQVCRECYWAYETKRLEDLRGWERYYCGLYQRWFGPRWREFVDSNEITLYWYRKHPHCPYCERSHPSFSYMERRSIVRPGLRWGISMACPYTLKEEVYAKSACPDALDYFEHGGARALPNFVFVCPSCKKRRGSMPLPEWVALHPQKIQANVKSLYRQRTGRRLEEGPKVNEADQRLREQLRAWEKDPQGLGLPEALEKSPHFQAKWDRASIERSLKNIARLRWKEEPF